jgi:hypothetical protein
MGAATLFAANTAPNATNEYGQTVVDSMSDWTNEQAPTTTPTWQSPNVHPRPVTPP